MFLKIVAFTLDVSDHGFAIREFNFGHFPDGRVGLPRFDGI
jgi:hypothetical protein